MYDDSVALYMLATLIAKPRKEWGIYKMHDSKVQLQSLIAPDHDQPLIVIPCYSLPRPHQTDRVILRLSPKGVDKSICQKP